MRKTGYRLKFGTAIALALSVAATPLAASSHREAPNITELRKVDATDFYMFRSYAPGREGFVTFIANYQPDQGPGNGPNYYTLDPDAIYEIHIDSNGDANEDLTFQFDIANTLRGTTGTTAGRGITIPITTVPASGTTPATVVTQPIALRHIDAITPTNDDALGELESYTLTLITGDRRTGARSSVVAAAAVGAGPGTIAVGGASFGKPVDYIGQKSLPAYRDYANRFIYAITIPGCASAGRVFVGQRAEAFAVNLGGTFDLVNYVPIEAGAFPGGIEQDRANDDLIGKKNVTSFALEIPIACLTGTGATAGNGVIGAWTTASLPQARLLDPTPTYAAPQLDGGAYVQVSRLSHPLVNEVVVGLPNKDAFNAAQPFSDATNAQLASYVTTPTFPIILDTLFRGAVNGAVEPDFPQLNPTNYPRNDLVATFLTGITTLNNQSRPASGTTPAFTGATAEIMRLNTGVMPTPRANQSRFGVVGDDLAGYPNGRRPGDDTVDITLRVAMGRLCHPVPINGVATPLGLCTPEQAPTGLVPYTDGAPLSALDLQNEFPYLNNPIAGSPGTEARFRCTGSPACDDTND